MKLAHALLATTWDLAWIVFAVVIGCGPAPKPPVVDPSQPLAMCLVDPRFLVESSQCNGHTADGYLCVICMGDASCVSTSSFDFCTGAEGCADRRCR